MNLNLSLGLENVKIGGLEENNGHLEVILRKDSSSEICPICKSPSSSIKNYRIHRLIDKPLVSSHISLFVEKRRFNCFIPACPKKTFTEQIHGLDKKHIYTQRFEDLLEILYKHMDFPTIQKHLFDKYQISIPLSTIWHKLKDKPLQFQTTLQDIQNAKYVGLDEFSYTKGHSYGVLVINIDKHKIADMVAGGRDQKTAEAALSIFNPAFVEACCIDMHKPFKNACQNKFPNAIIVVDKFHVIKLLNEAIKDLIKRVFPLLPLNESQLKEFNKMGKWNLLRANEKLTVFQRAELPNLLSLNEDLKKIYGFKELLRTIYKTKDPQEAHTQLHAWLRHAKASKIPELVKVANSYSDWFTCIFNYWHCRISNGITEGKVNKIKVFRRKAYHFRNFHSLRYQVMKSEQYNFKK